MDLASFRKSLSENAPPKDASVYLQSLWYDAKGDWERSHTIIQDVPDKNAAWIHAYLHRKEGDTGNADYWYSRAGRRRSSKTLADEWEQIVVALI